MNLRGGAIERRALAVALGVVLLAAVVVSTRAHPEPSQISEIREIPETVALEYDQPERSPKTAEEPSSTTTSEGSLATAAPAPAPPDPAPALASLPDPLPTVNVRDFGAGGEGKTNDTSAIQLANDEVAAQGGGIVLFPPGEYRALGVMQDSSVELRGTEGAVMKHLDGSTDEPIVRSRTIPVQGSIEAGSTVLEVDDASPFVEGGVVAVRGAGGGSPHQYSFLSSRVGRDPGVVTLRSGEGFAKGVKYRPNHLLIGNEMVSYNRVVGGLLFGVKRGLYGTQAATHSSGTRVAQLQALMAKVESVGDGHVVLDRPAELGVRDAPVVVGSVGMKLTNLTLDGTPQTNGQIRRLVDYRLARFVTVSGNTFVNAHKGALEFAWGTRDGLIENNTFVDTGTKDVRSAGSIWIMQGSSANTLRGNRFLGERTSASAILVDDRSVESTQYDASSDHNVIESNDINIPFHEGVQAIGIFGSSHNIVRSNAVAGTHYGVHVYTGGQGTIQPPTDWNLVTDNSLTNHYTGILVNGSDNRFERNVMYDVRQPVLDQGTRNKFVD